MKIYEHFRSWFMKLAVLAIVAVLALASSALAQWSAPTALPPGGNVSAPLNVSSTGQSKAGGLILNTGGAANGLIVSSGNVGIGTSNPNAKLHVSKPGYVAGYSPTIKMTNDHGDAIVLEAYTNNTPGSYDGEPYGGVPRILMTPLAGPYSAMVGTTNDTPLHLLTNATKRFTILGGGNVGIGTSTPAQKFSVNGPIYSGTGGFKFPDGTIQTTAANSSSGTSGLSADSNVNVMTFYGMYYYTPSDYAWGYGTIPAQSAYNMSNCPSGWITGNTSIIGPTITYSNGSQSSPASRTCYRESGYYPSMIYYGSYNYASTNPCGYGNNPPCGASDYNMQSCPSGWVTANSSVSGQRTTNENGSGSAPATRTCYKVVVATVAPSPSINSFAADPSGGNIDDPIHVSGTASQGLSCITQHRIYQTDASGIAWNPPSWTNVSCQASITVSQYYEFNSDDIHYIKWEVKDSADRISSSIVSIEIVP